MDKFRFANVCGNKQGAGEWGGDTECCTREVGVMIQIRIVKSARNEAEQEDDEDNYPHDTKVLKALVLTWDNIDRIVCADSYFASVPAAE